MAQSEPEENFNGHIDVHLTPEQLEHLGHIVALWGAIETLVDFLILALSGIKEIQLYLLMFDGKMLTAKSDALTILVKQRLTGSKLKAASKYCSKLKGLISERNHVVHGQWGEIYDGPVLPSKPEPSKLRPGAAYNKNPDNPFYATKLKAFRNKTSELAGETIDLCEYLGITAGKAERPVTMEVAKGARLKWK